jgi:hypothetical protein
MRWPSTTTQGSSPEAHLSQDWASRRRVLDGVRRVNWSEVRLLKSVSGTQPCEGG